MSETPEQRRTDGLPRTESLDGVDLRACWGHDPLAASLPASASTTMNRAAMTAPADAAKCEVTLTPSTQWPVPYPVTVGIKNVDSVPARVLATLQLRSGDKITQMWGASYSQLGRVVTIFPNLSGGVLSVGDQTWFGYVATGPVEYPDVSCTPT
jgi:hypothetical protein